MAKWYEEDAPGVPQVPRVRDLLGDGAWQWEAPEWGKWMDVVRDALSPDLFPFAGVRLTVQVTLDLGERTVYTPAEARRRAEAYVVRAGESAETIRLQIACMDWVPLRVTLAMAVRSLPIRANTVRCAWVRADGPVDATLRDGLGEGRLEETTSYFADTLIRSVEESLHTIRQFPGISTQVLTPAAFESDAWAIRPPAQGV